MYLGKVVVFGQKWLFSGKSGVIRAKVVVFRQKNVVFGQELLYSGKLVVFGKVVVFGQKCLYSGKSCCIRESGIIPVKVVVFGQSGRIWAKWL